MRYPEFHYRWEWTLDAEAEALWPLVADTNRFNRDTGVPAVERRDDPERPLTNARRHLRLYRLGVPVEWVEEPFEWVKPYRFGVMRNYLTGPVKKMTVLAELMPQPTGGTKLVYQVWARPRDVLGLAAIPFQIGFLSARDFGRAFQSYDKVVARKEPLPLPRERVRFAPGGQARLQALRLKLLEQGTEANIVNQIIEMLEQGDNLTLAKMRPYQLADQWDEGRTLVLEHFLRATRVGMLEFQWDLLCPLCRNPRQSATHMDGIQREVHCNTCNIDFSVNFDRSVELTFRPNPAILDVQVDEFCIAGPRVTPHVVVQQLLAPDETRTVEPRLEDGYYRLRSLGLRGGEYYQVHDDGIEEITLRVSAIDDWADTLVHLSHTPKIHLKNATDNEQLFVLEQMSWNDQTVTAAEVTALQLFRDLFADEALRPGEQISVGSVTILFTDLRNSTKMYNEIGDAPAFGLVMQHFDVLKASIAAEGGAIVKTIGDAVMAVFRRPAPALRAIFNAQQILAQSDNGERPLELRAGVHTGPCIAVTLNERLDYFGSTVNLAARLETFSSGVDLIISDTVRDDPEVAEMLDDDYSSFTAEAFEAKLKGFTTDTFTLWRITPADPVARFERLTPPQSTAGGQAAM